MLSLLKFVRTPVIVGAALLWLALQPGAADPPGTPLVHRLAAGDYQHLWLDLEDKVAPARIFVGLRGGASTTVWLLGGVVPGGVEKKGAHRVLVDSHELTVTSAGVQGVLRVRQVGIWAPMALLAQVNITIDAQKTSTGFAGTWASEIVGGKKSTGRLRGVLTDEASLRKQQTFTAGVDWPSYHGPHAANRAADSRWPLVADLAKARPVWRAEQALLSGWGTGVDSRYKQRAAMGTVCGGSSSPVIADGRVYLFHYVPAGDPDPKVLAQALADFEKSFKRKPLSVEHDALVDFARPYSDTIVTCLDAQTGAVLWRVTFPRMSGNYQTHKWRGFNPTPCVLDGVVIANDLANNWVALDAVKGDVLWTIKRSQKVEGDRAALGAVAAAGLAILPTNGNDPVRAVEPRTGKVVWQQPGGPQVLVWKKKDGERVVFLGREGPTCHDAATGKPLWKMPEKLVGHTGSAALIEGDILVGHVIPDPKKGGGFFQGWKLADSGPTKLWQDDFLRLDENLTVTLSPTQAFVVGRSEIRTLDLATGKLLVKHAFDDKSSPIGSNQWLGLVGDRLLLSPEGQHGSQSLRLLSISELKVLGEGWAPPHNHTTAYAVHSIAFPVVDGRLFVRGMDGLYCYDLRDFAQPKQE